MNKQLPVLLLLIVLSGYLSSCSLLKKGGKRKKRKGYTTTVVVPSTGTVLPVPPVVPVQPMKPTLDTGSNDAGNTAIANAEMKELIDRITPYWTKRIDYKTFSGKAKVHVETPDAGNDFTAHFRIRKDSVIWVNVNLAGISVARVFVTRDSIFMIDYFHKEAKCLPLSQIAKILPTAVDFASLQNLIVGDPLVDGTITNAQYGGDSLFVRTENSDYIQHITYMKKDSTMHNEVLETKQASGPKALSAYSNYELVGDRRISAGRVVNVQVGSVMYLLEMDFNKMDFDEQQDYPFSIPNKYR